MDLQAIPSLLFPGHLFKLSLALESPKNITDGERRKKCEIHDGNASTCIVYLFAYIITFTLQPGSQWRVPDHYIMRYSMFTYISIHWGQPLTVSSPRWVKLFVRTQFLCTLFDMPNVLFRPAAHPKRRAVDLKGWYSHSMSSKGGIAKKCLSFQTMTK